MALLKNKKAQKSKTLGWRQVARDPLVSIITVSRDAERTIARTIESVLHQSYDRIEYIVVDGGSTDNTVEIVKRYEPRFRGRMRLVSQTDEGIYDAMNRGITLSKGQIIGLINSDDYYESDAVRLVVDSYRKNGDAVYYGVVRIMENEREIMLKAVNQQYLDRDVVAHPAYFVTKRIYSDHGKFRLEYKYASDYELMMRFRNAGVPFVQIDRVVATFNQGGTSSRHGLQTLVELLKIRRSYGFITTWGLWYQVCKYRLLYALKNLGLRL